MSAPALRLVPAGHVWTAPELIAGWNTAQRARGLSERTIAVQSGYLRRVDRDGLDLLTVTGPELEQWMAAQRWKPPSLMGARAALRSFYRWAKRRRLIVDSPADYLESVRVPVKAAKPVPENVLSACLASATGETRLMVLLGAFAGLRASEIARVHTADLEGDLLRVTGKGGRVRLVPIGGELLAQLQTHPPGYLFPSPVRPGHPIVAGRVTQRLSTLLPGEHTAHKLRHRYATRVYARSGDLMALQQLLGHSSPETTRVYVLTDLDQLRRAAATALD